MSNKRENENMGMPSSTSCTSSAKKIPRKSTIVVRHTLTSKLRAERGDKLQFIKNEIQKLSEKQSQTNASSKDSLNSIDPFKKPVNSISNFKIPAQKPKHAVSKTNLVNTATKKDINTSTKKEVSTLSVKDVKANKTTISITVRSKTFDKPTDSKLIKNPTNPVKTVKTTMISNVQTTKKTYDAANRKPNLITKSTVNSCVTNDEKFKNRLSLAANAARTSISTKFNQGKQSLLPNQFKTLPKNDEKPRRQTFMPHNIQKKETVQKPVASNKNIVPSKPALKVSGAPTNGLKKTVTVQSPLRKSLTAMHFKKTTKNNRNSTIHRTMSWSNGLSPVRLPEMPEEISFRTPTMARRRSVAYQTPMSIGKKSMSPFTILSTPTTSDLKRRLGLWLEKKGKPLDSFHHLRCFGIRADTVIDDENKENFEVYIPDKNNSYEDLKILEKPKKVEDKSKNILVANDAMYDLHKLILEGYPRDQCEAWLEIICTRFGEVQDKPQYWECRAALEEARGNYQSAIDCYSNAIAKGAEVQNVNAPLDSLLEKFSVLNINQNDSKPSDKQTKAVLDARNVFKSSIINFAVQERDKKLIDEDGCRYSATPVRRSTRMSRSAYTTTPNMKICSTLDELDSPVRDNLKFQTNRGFKH